MEFNTYMIKKRFTFVERFPTNLDKEQRTLWKTEHMSTQIEKSITFIIFFNQKIETKVDNGINIDPLFDITN